MSKPMFSERAFSFYAFRPDGSTDESYGMTLRDWFAGQALVGLLSGCSVNTCDPSKNHFAEMSYIAADAMLEARAK